MTRKDYQVIAEGIGKVRPLVIFSEEFKMWERAVWSLAEELERENPRFDVDKFVKHANDALSLRGL